MQTQSSVVSSLYLAEAINFFTSDLASWLNYSIINLINLLIKTHDKENKSVTNNLYSIMKIQNLIQLNIQDLQTFSWGFGVLGFWG